jgi:uracil permease
MKTSISGYLPNDRPPLGQLILLGLQHVLTMFPATVLVALLCGFHPNTVLLGAGTPNWILCPIAWAMPRYEAM